MEVKLENTKLYLSLIENYRQTRYEKIAAYLSANVLKICKKASNRMKAAPNYFPQYTLHDEVHLVQVVYLMGKLILDSVFKSLNPIEIFILILSAYLHDQGMVVNQDEYDKMTSHPEFQLSLKNWEIKYSNLRDLKKKIEEQNITKNLKDELHKKIDSLLSSHLTYYLRDNHGKRSEDYIISNYRNDQ